MRSEKRYPRIAGILVAAVLAAGLASGAAWADAGHDHRAGNGPEKGEATAAMPDHQGGTLEEAAAGNSGTTKANGPTALLMPIRICVIGGSGVPKSSKIFLNFGMM